MIADQIILNKKGTKSDYVSDKKSERPIRSIAKAISWRVIGTLDTLLISYLLTGEVALAASTCSSSPCALRSGACLSLLHSPK
ncbi:MAG: hypothetical protein COC08_09255 [Maribacter sp.]|nr:MAG: hypothetical protein COC08_09255 [Maribacter sp.]